MAEKGEESELHGKGGNGTHAASGRGGGHHPSGPHEEAHEGAPEWLISFADNVLLQMGFFVILLAMTLKTVGGASTGGPKKEGQEGTGGPTVEQLDFALAVRQAFNNPVDIGSTDPKDWLLVQRLRMRAMGQSEAQQEGLKGRERDVQSIRQSGVFGAGGAIAFDTGSVALSDAVRADVTELARHFRGCQTVLDVRGHCSAAEAFGQDDRGMRLTYERAIAVARELVAQGIEWRRLRLTACGDNDRITPTTYDEAGHRSNQRVEIVEVNEAAPAP